MPLVLFSSQAIFQLESTLSQKVGGFAKKADFHDPGEFIPLYNIRRWLKSQSGSSEPIAFSVTQVQLS